LKKTAHKSLIGVTVGFFITFEGIEGSGKSTQMEMLKRYLEGRGESVLAVREPGCTLMGERVRDIILNSWGEPEDPKAELFLYEACRAQLVSNIIRPELKGGRTIICDRFTDSTLAYQGYARGLDMDAIRYMNNWATGGLKPDLTILIDLPPEEGLRRVWGRGALEDRFEKESVLFHKKVREGYLKIAESDPGRVRVVDGAREIPVIHGDICGIINKVNV
jgi:dTMP kinase